jgi:serine/threonine-protein kinase
MMQPTAAHAINGLGAKNGTMSSNPQVLELVHEILETNREPEDVCAEHPELLWEVCKRLKQAQLVEAQLEELFPSTVDPPAGTRKACAFVGDDLPKIPGYEVEKIIGHGGVGIVFEARHLKLNRLVALKMLLSGTFASRQECARFIREAEAVAGLQHPHIVQVYDVGEFERRLYFTMEFVEGGNLAQQLAGVPQPAMQSAHLLATLAEAVGFAHGHGIVHRDLKPANILMTVDGTPKIADFGLARRVDADQDLTMTGVRLGTPSYMAPEQASGKSNAAGPLVDVYALGAILYEMLTGRPPFRAETSAETERQVIAEEPARPSHLNFSVPRDLETICLKCLSKDPSRRYPTAAAMADDLHHFLRGEPISARRPGPLERIGKWVRRRPAVAVFIGASTLLTAVLIGALVWIAVQQVSRRHGIEANLREINHLEEQARWTDAGVALQQLDAELDAAGIGDWRERVDQARRDLELVTELDNVRLTRLTGGNLAYYKADADRRYADAFAKSGLAKVNDAPDEVARRVKASAVHLALNAALDEWAVCSSDKRLRDWLLTISRKADHESLDWGDRIRDSAQWNNQVAMSELAKTVPTSRIAVSLLLALAERLAAAHGDPTAFLKRVQRDHPNDFWANMILGDSLLADSPVEANGYYRAALAIRPQAVVAYTALGDSLRHQKLYNEALVCYRQALEIDPNYARNLTNLGNLLRDLHQTDEAIAYYRKALDADPNYAWAHFDLANTLRDSGRADDAIEHYKQFNAIGPSIPYVANMVRSDLVRHGRGEEARLEWKKALELDPPEHDPWFGYAELCLFLGNENEYRRARQDLIQRFGNTNKPNVAEKTCRAILLMPPSAEELRTATKLAETAVAAKPTTEEWIYPYYVFAKGLAEYRQGHFDIAIADMDSEAATVMGPCPRFVKAMAEYRLGHEQEARTMLAAEIAANDWRMSEVRSHDQWIWHVIRREAETTVFPHTAEFLKGEYNPRDNTERLALLGVCQFKNLTCALARLYADAFAADPELAGDRQFAHRYRAACAAAMAGAGKGTDVAKVSDTARAHWREQARDWLQAELAERIKILDKGSAADANLAKNSLASWQTDPDLAGLRDPDALARLPTAERAQWQGLWGAVGAAVHRRR